MAEPPYKVGDPAVWTDRMGERMEMTATRAESVTRVGDDWVVKTALGSALVNDSGVGERLMPVDGELARELLLRGGRAVVVETERDVEPELKPPPPPKELRSSREVGGRDVN